MGSTGLGAHGVGHFTEDGQAPAVGTLQEVVVKHLFGGAKCYHPHIKQQKAVEVGFSIVYRICLLSFQLNFSSHELLSDLPLRTQERIHEIVGKNLFNLVAFLLRQILLICTLKNILLKK